MLHVCLTTVVEFFFCKCCSALNWWKHICHCGWNMSHKST